MERSPRRRLRSAAGSVLRYLKKRNNKVQFTVWRWYSRFRFGSKRQIKTTFGPPLTVRTDDWRAFWIWRMGGTQQHLVNIWQAYLQARPQVFIDVGANYGEFTSAICGQAAQALAIEPNKQIFECLKLTFAHAKQVAPLNCAVGRETHSAVPFFYKPSMSGYSSLAESVVAPFTSPADFRENVTTATVEMDTLDNIVCATYGKFPQSFVLKIDIEGYEPEALKGAQRLMDHALWWRAIVEFNPRNLRARGEDPAQVWTKTYRNFHGIIVESKMESAVESRYDLAVNDLATMNIDLYTLPEYPAIPCNVLIGAGSIVTLPPTSSPLLNSSTTTAPAPVIPALAPPDKP